MRAGKFCEELHRRFGGVRDDDPNALDELLRIANETAREHPLQYERFRWRVELTRWWRMGDFQNMWRDLRNIRKMQAEKRSQLIVEILCWVIAAICFYVILRYYA